MRAGSADALAPRVARPRVSVVVVGVGSAVACCAVVRVVRLVGFGGVVAVGVASARAVRRFGRGGGACGCGEVVRGAVAVERVARRGRSGGWLCTKATDEVVEVDRVERGLDCGGGLGAALADVAAFGRAGCFRGMAQDGMEWNEMGLKGKGLER